MKKKKKEARDKLNSRVGTTFDLKIVIEKFQ